MEQTSPTRILRLPEVCRRVGYRRASIYKFVKANTFPQPVKIGPGAIGFLEAEIDAWIASKVATRDAAHAG